MLHTRRTLWLTVRILVVCEVLAGPLVLRATEKHWIAHQAQAIVVGTFDPYPAFPWFDGWHVNGVITVDEILYGGTLPRQINFRYACKWKNLCEWWPPPKYQEFTLQKGLWFLRRIDSNAWESAVFSDAGFRYLSEQAYWENYIRLHKR